MENRMIERAAELWKRMLRTPRFDNSDTSERGGLAASMAYVASPERSEERLEAFRVALVERLIFLRDHDGEEIGKPHPYNAQMMETYRFPHSLDVDYDPCEVLAHAARQAGFERVNKTLFPWKTNMGFYDPKCIGVSAGYAAPTLYHYPMSDGVQGFSQH